MSLSLDNLPLRLIACVLATCILVLLIEPLALWGRRGVPGREACQSVTLAVRLSFVLLVFSFFFAISWRPLYGLAATVSFHAIFTAISFGKDRFVREPLVFADVALLPMLLRHREMFYADFVGILFWVGSLLYVFGASALFYYFEPIILPQAHSSAWIALGLFIALAPWLALFSGRSRAGALAAKLLDDGEPVKSTRRFGVFAYLVLHFLSWLGKGVLAVPQPRTTAIERAGGGAGPAPVIVVWQSESFYDLRWRGLDGPPLPNIERLRRRSARWGLLDSIFDGGYTMRTEFAILTGVEPTEMGPDAFYPYLRPSAYGAAAWPTIFSQNGWATTFIHPYDRNFFRRHKAIPKLGFQRMFMIDSFEPVATGTYVTDDLLAERVLEICRQGADRPQFIFAASIENHGPWLPGRIEGAVEPFDIYRAILERSDVALGRLVDGLDELDRPVWFAFYGDHPPLLAAFPDGFADARTDYLILETGNAGRSMGNRVDCSPWALIQELVAQASTKKLGSAS